MTLNDSQQGEPLSRTARAPGTLDRLKETEPWAAPAPEPFDPDVRATVATALERAAARVRAGDVVLPPNARATSDEGALALTLAAMLSRPQERRD
jgi:hypothetical protein